MEQRYLITVHCPREFLLKYVAYEDVGSLGDGFAWVPATLASIRRNEKPPHILGIFRRLRVEGWDMLPGMTLAAPNEVHTLWTRIRRDEGQNMGVDSELATA